MAVQTNEEHSHGVAEFAMKFASQFGYGSLGYAIGELHDKGKEKIDFQKYIRFKSGLDTSETKWGNKDHAYVGALMAKNLYGGMYPLLSYAIAGHHAGLSDYTDLEKTMEMEIPTEILEEKAQLFSMEIKVKPAKNEIHHIIRMLFSSLVDADYLDTERFMMPESYKMRKHNIPLSSLINRLNKYLDNLTATAVTSDVNKLRQSIQNVCKEKSVLKPGFIVLLYSQVEGKLWLRWYGH